MTGKERAERLARAQAQQDAIRRARETARLARLLWPRGEEDDLHGKVEILTQRLRAAGQTDAAQQVAANAHRAAWRKVKHTQHIADEGDLTQAPWWQNAIACMEYAVDVRFAASPAARLGRKDLVDAAYWAVEDTLDELETAQDGIPCSCADRSHVWGLMRGIADEEFELQHIKCDLVAWAEAHDYTITR